jgi:pimeloyl-ACP methyl ester carboxylesterase
MNPKIIRIISTLFPNQVVNFAYKVLTNPQVKKLRSNEITVLDKSEKATFSFKGFDIQTYIWKGGEKSVLLIHGWEGQAGNFADLITELMTQNYTIYAFDGPSHGFSSKGKTSLFEFTELVGLLIEKWGVKKLVSHSFGGVATTFALASNPHLAIEKYVLLTTPDRFLERIEDVAAATGITEKVKQKLIQRLEKETNMDISLLNVSAFVKKVNVAKAIIIHDKADKVLPISRSLNVYKNWDNCTFWEIEGTGHFKILRTDFVLAKTLDFLKDE